jgi:hypothetical protein
MSHPNYPTKRVEVCEKCFRETLLARDGQHFETVPGPVANTMMLSFANLLTGSMYEAVPGQPIKVHRNSFVMRNLPMAKPSTAGGWQSEDIAVKIDDTFNVMMRWYHPAPFNPTTPMGALVYFHGGGWTAGSVFQKDQDTNYRNFCKAFGLMFFAVEYRLSPENPCVPTQPSRVSLAVFGCRVFTPLIFVQFPYTFRRFVCCVQTRC